MKANESHSDAILVEEYVRMRTAKKNNNESNSINKEMDKKIIKLISIYLQNENEIILMETCAFLPFYFSSHTSPKLLNKGL